MRHETIRVTLTGIIDHQRTVTWPTNLPIPREGDTVDLPGISGPLAVRRVVWYPEGDPEQDDHLPFVYIVIGRPRL